MKKSTQKLKKITRVLFGRTAFVIIAILMAVCIFLHTYKLAVQIFCAYTFIICTSWYVCCHTYF